MSLYNIAELKVNMDLKYSLTRKKAEPYYVGEDVSGADFSVSVSEERLDKYAKRFNNADAKDEYEYYIASSDFYWEMLKFGGIMLHSSAVVVDGKAYLFSAKSGTGKSTHTSLWLKLLGDKAYILNDDKPAIRLVDGKVRAFGTPFSGKVDLHKNIGVDIGAICFIERSEENSIKQITVAEALPLILAQVPFTSESEALPKTLDVLDKLLTQIPCFKLNCNMDISAAELSYNTLKKAVKINE